MALSYFLHIHFWRTALCWTEQLHIALFLQIHHPCCFCQTESLYEMLAIKIADHVWPHQPETSTSGFSTCKIAWDQPPDSWCNSWFAQPKYFLHKLLETWLLFIEQNAPWGRWAYGISRIKVRTTNTGAFYWWQFECTGIPWRHSEAHCRAIHSPPSPHVSMIMHGSML